MAFFQRGNAPEMPKSLTCFFLEIVLEYCTRKTRKEHIQYNLTFNISWGEPKCCLKELAEGKSSIPKKLRHMSNRDYVDVDFQILKDMYIIMMFEMTVGEGTKILELMLSQTW